MDPILLFCPKGDLISYSYTGASSAAIAALKYGRRVTVVEENSGNFRLAAPRLQEVAMEIRKHQKTLKLSMNVPTICRKRSSAQFMSTPMLSSQSKVGAPTWYPHLQPLKLKHLSHPNVEMRLNCNSKSYYKVQTFVMQKVVVGWVAHQAGQSAGSEVGWGQARGNCLHHLYTKLKRGAYETWEAHQDAG